MILRSNSIRFIQIPSDLIFWENFGNLIGRYQRAKSWSLVLCVANSDPDPAGQLPFPGKH